MEFTMEKDTKRLIILAVSTVIVLLLFAQVVPVVLALHILATGISLILGVQVLRSKGALSAWDTRYKLSFRKTLSRVIGVLFLLTAAFWPVAAALHMDTETSLQVQIVGVVVAGSLSFIPVTLKKNTER